MRYSDSMSLPFFSRFIGWRTINEDPLAPRTEVLIGQIGGARGQPNEMPILPH